MANGWKVTCLMVKRIAEFAKMQDEMPTVEGLAKELGLSARTVHAYLRIIRSQEKRKHNTSPSVPRGTEDDNIGTP